MMGPHPHADETAIAARVEAAIGAFNLPVWTVAPTALSMTVHEDADNLPRVLFLINPTATSEEATFTLHRRALLTDVFDDSRHECRVEGATVFVPARPCACCESI